MLLYSRICGFTLDYNQQFAPKRKLQKYDIIVELDETLGATNLFKFKRMAKPYEHLADVSFFKKLHFLRNYLVFYIFFKLIKSKPLQLCNKNDENSLIVFC